MKHALVFLSLALATAATVASAAPAVAQSAPEVATVTVGGDGMVERSPDLARLTVEIVTNNDDPTVSSSQNNDRYNVLVAKMSAIGIAGSSLRTYGYDVTYIPEPPKDLPPAQRQPRYGYITTRTVQITIAPIEGAGKAIDAANAAGVTSVGDLNYDLKDRASAYQAALVAALADAKRTAETLASAGGFTLVRLLRVTNVQNTGVRPLGLQMSARALAAPATPTDLGASGPIQVSAEVTVSYEIR